MPKRWKKQEIAYLKRYAKKKRVEELAQRFRTGDDQVRKKLQELALNAKDWQGAAEPDPMLGTYEKGLKAFYDGQRKEAARLFEEVIAGADQAELVQRARQFLAAGEERSQGGAEAEAEDPFLEAVYEKNRGNLDEALAICARGGRQSKDERFAYLAASIHALLGAEEEAIKFLTLATELNPKNRIHAYYDADFSELRVRQEHAHLFGLD